MSDWLFYLFIILLIVLNFVLISSKFSLQQTRQSKLLTLRETIGINLNRAQYLINNQVRVRSSQNLGIIFVKTLIVGVIVFQLVNRFQFKLAWVLLILMAVSLVIFWLEWIIEKWIEHNPEIWTVRLSLFSQAVLYINWLFLSPFLLLSKQSQFNDESISGVTEEDVKTLLEAGEEEGYIELDERKRIISIFQLGDTLVREIMIPRIDIHALEVRTLLPQAVDAMLKTGHSRMPVYEGTIENMLGLLYAKDLLRVWREGGHYPTLKSLLRPAYFIPEAKTADELLEELQSQRIHMAIVVDEYGGVAGLVTIEDIVEEIFGEIRDEYDQAEEAPFIRLKGGAYQFLGRVDLDDFNGIMGSDLPNDEADTIGGFLYRRIGRVPEKNNRVQVGNLLLTIEQVQGRRISQVRAEWLEDHEDDDGKKDD